ncbi:hypothetical protein NDU88_002771 [Pleurodeles waltl]|uniref:Uncharacterized protein n=1 Tax=Pleurodeles waltl TaxID=8319 RepID=A0AAV7UWM8_PLEWA|nr:hypothetical protein NDU88_002771 [Pleurodeles waltl]
MSSLVGIWGLGEHPATPSPSATQQQKPPTKQQKAEISNVLRQTLLLLMEVEEVVVDAGRAEAAVCGLRGARGREVTKVVVAGGQRGGACVERSRVHGLRGGELVRV